MTDQPAQPSAFVLRLAAAVAEVRHATNALLELTGKLDADATGSTPIWEWPRAGAEAFVGDILAARTRLHAKLDVYDLERQQPHLAKETTVVNADNAAQALAEAERLLCERELYAIAHKLANWTGEVATYTVPNPSAVFTNQKVAHRWCQVARLGRKLGIRVECRADSLPAFAGVQLLRYLVTA